MIEAIITAENAEDTIGAAAVLTAPQSPNARERPLWARRDNR
ncbi:hypothetical protein ACWGDE_06625 [Streptomyces sp. NPDC054956]